MPKRRSVEDNIHDLTSTDPLIIIKALDRLCEAGPSATHAVSLILPLLSDTNWKIRAAAARCFGYIGSQADATVAGLIDALHDPKAPVRVNAAVALGVVGKKSAVAVLALTSVLQDSHPSVRVAAGIALNTIDPLLSSTSANPVIDEWQARPVEKRIPKPETVGKYVAALKGSDSKKYISAMRKISSVLDVNQENLNALIFPIIPDLISLLGDPSWKIRSWAARLLGRIGPKADSAVSDLVHALQDHSITVRSCAAYALGRLGEYASVAIPALEETLHDPDRSVRTSAHMALRYLRHEDDLLGPILNEDDELAGYPVDDDRLDIHYWVLGHVRQRPWHYRTNLVLQSKQYTLDQLRAMVHKTPEDYRAKIMLAERMENLDEKIEYIRNNFTGPGTESHDEWQKAWLRLYDECPTYIFTGIDSIHEFAIPEKFEKILLSGNTDEISELIFLVGDFIDAAGVMKQGFLGERLDEKVFQSFDRVIKLTYRHFLCQQGSVFTLYHSRDGVFLVPAAKVFLEEEATLEKILLKISEANPQACDWLSHDLQKDPGRNAYLSRYRLYVTFFDDFTNHFAYGRVIINNDFHITPLDLV